MDYFITVVGAGPNGIYAFNKFKKIFFDKDILLIEKNDIINNIKSYPNILWHSPFNELCFDDENKNDLSHPMGNKVIKYYHEYSKKNNIKFLKENVNHIEKYNKNYKIKTNTCDIISKYIILCTGIYENKNKLNINTNFDYISYSYCDFSIKNKNLVLIGGGNSSIDYIINLLQYNKITWIVRSNSYTYNSAHLNILHNTINKYKNNLKYYNNCEVIEFYENNSLKLSNGLIVKNIDFCNVLIGFNFKNQLLKNIGIEYDEYNYIKVNKHFETNLKNIFVFGSLATKNNDIVYIHNGNPKRLSKIINSISNKV